jgi:NAD(P)-dependent dehydrogenase (short-subunit alcohol dehydrogenase family)
MDWTTDARLQDKAAIITATSEGLGYACALSRHGGAS